MTAVAVVVAVSRRRGRSQGVEVTEVVIVLKVDVRLVTTAPCVGGGRREGVGPAYVTSPSQLGQVALLL